MTSIAGVDGLFETHLIVADLDASIAFYRDRLGLDLAHATPARRAAHMDIRGDAITIAARRSSLARNICVA